jgi:multicomponent Na+:H+ antiporter subunit E
VGIVFSGAQVRVVEVKTPLRNRFLRTILANSITLVPGSVTLDLKGDKITVLWLTKKTTDIDGIEDLGEQVKGRLERMLDKTH